MYFIASTADNVLVTKNNAGFFAKYIPKSFYQEIPGRVATTSSSLRSATHSVAKPTLRTSLHFSLKTTPRSTGDGSSGKWLRKPRDFLMQFCLNINQGVVHGVINIFSEMARSLLVVRCGALDTTEKRGRHRLQGLFLASPGLIAYAGLIIIVLGLAIVISHSVWEFNYRGLIMLIVKLSHARQRRDTYWLPQAHAESGYERLFDKWLLHFVGCAHRPWPISDLQRLHS